MYSRLVYLLYRDQKRVPDAQELEFPTVVNLPCACWEWNLGLL